MQIAFPFEGEGGALAPDEGGWSLTLSKTDKKATTLFQKAPAGRSKGGPLEVPPPIPLEPSSGRALKSPQLHRIGQPTIPHTKSRTTCTVAQCGEVLGVLRGDWLRSNQSVAQRCFLPKEAPKRGSGRRPEVSTKPPLPPRNFWVLCRL